jgi:hypothetical protein
MTSRPSVLVFAVAMFASLTLSACAIATTQQGQPSVWACHGKKNSKWIRVAAPAADAHRRHGDRVTSVPQDAGSSCRQ